MLSENLIFRHKFSPFLSFCSIENWIKYTVWRKRFMPVPSIPSFFEILEDSWLFLCYSPGKRAQTPQPLFASLLVENNWLPWLVLLFQTGAPTNTSVGSFFPCLASERILQPSFFIMPFSFCFVFSGSSPSAFSHPLHGFCSWCFVKSISFHSPFPL